MTHYKHNPDLTQRAKELRSNMTKEERKLWFCYLRSRRPRFLRQKVIDNYIVDFYCAEARLIIELDGSQHYEDTEKEYDKLRTEALERRGLRVIRIPNNEINHNFEGVCLFITKIMNESPLSAKPTSPLFRDTPKIRAIGDGFLAGGTHACERSES